MSELTRKKLQEILRSQSLHDLSLPEMIRDIMEEPQIMEYLPDAICQLDPRNGAMIVYNSSRAKRPNSVMESDVKATTEAACPICQGKSTRIIDVAEQSEGFTFINKNLYPVFHPLDQLAESVLERPLYDDPLHSGRSSYGCHFLQWSSSHHEKDLHNLPVDDVDVCMERLSALEEKLLYESAGFMPPVQFKEEGDVHGFVSIIKNYGQAAGASMSHGHQQITLSNIMSSRMFNNQSFAYRHKKTFSAYMIKENPEKLLVQDYGTALLMVPYFMRRPFDMLLINKDVSKQYLHELTSKERKTFTIATQQAIQAIFKIMPQMGKEPAYNLTINNGPGTGIYFELLPKTQEMGGYEQVGLWVCQANPYECVKQLQDMIDPSVSDE